MVLKYFMSRLTLKSIVKLLPVGVCVLTFIFIQLISSHCRNSKNFIVIPRHQLSETDVMFMRDLPGYPHGRVRKEDYPQDLSLLSRIHLAQDLFKYPVVTVKTVKDKSLQSSWKFEKIIHQTWMSELIPGRTAPWVQKWLKINPDWTYMFWTDANARSFVREHFPSLLNVYDSWTIPVQRADMFRYLVLYAFGGVYADLDVEPLRPLDDIREWGSCILSREPDIQTFLMVKSSPESNDLNVWANNWTFSCNAFMACRSHHPFMYYVIAKVVQKSPYVVKSPCVLDETIVCTGPFLVSLAFTYYRRSIPERTRIANPATNVICPESEWFLPTFDPSRETLVRERCREKKLSPRNRQLCDDFELREFKNTPLPKSFTDHHWFHSYHQDVNRKVVNINTITNALQWTLDDEDKFEVRNVKSADVA